jgi:hypothetical protein
MWMNNHEIHFVSTKSVSINQSTDSPINQSINQSDSTDLSTFNHSFIINQSINHGQATHNHRHQSTNQSININQSIAINANQSINQSTK